MSELKPKVQNESSGLADKKMLLTTITAMRSFCVNRF